jgi:hypothetical protein
MELVKNSGFGGSSVEPSLSATGQLTCFLIFYKVLERFIVLGREQTEFNVDLTYRDVLEIGPAALAPLQPRRQI